MKKRGIFALLLLAILFVASLGGFTAVQALEIRGGDEIIIAADEVVDDDLYAAGQAITVDGVIKGDLVVAGQNIVINGVVEGDLLAAGQSVVIAGQVEDDARVIAAVIQVQSGGRVGDDLVGMGYSLETQANSSVDGTVLFAGNQALIAGDVGENVQVAAGGLSLQGRVNGDVEASVGEQGAAAPPFFMFMPNMPPAPMVPPGLTVEGAEIRGRLRYSAPEPATLPEGIEAIYEPAPVTAPPEPTPLDHLLDGVRRFISISIVGLIMLSLLRRPGEEMLALIREQFGKIFLWGVIVFFGGFVVFMIMAIILIILVVLLYTLTLGGLGTLALLVGLIILAVYSVGMYVAATWMAQALVSLWVGRLIFARFNPNGASRAAWPLLVGAFILTIFLTIPILGGMVGLLCSFLGLGALLQWWLQRHDRKLLETDAPAPANIA